MLVQSIIIIIVIAVVLLYMHNRRQYEYAQRLNWYNRRTRPIIVFSAHPHDDTVSDRAALHRLMLAQSGNKWQVAVYEFTYADVQYNSAQYEDFYLEYPQRLGEFAAKVGIGNAVHLKALDQKAYTEHVLNQKKTAI